MDKDVIIKCYGLDEPDDSIYRYERITHCTRKSIELLETLNIGENTKDRLKRINNYRNSLNNIKISNSRMDLLRSLNIGNNDEDRERANSKSQENNLLQDSNIIINDSESLIIFKDLVRNISKELEYNNLFTNSFTNSNISIEQTNINNEIPINYKYIETNIQKRKGLTKFFSCFSKYN